MRAALLYIEIAADVLLTSELEDVIGDVRLSFSQVYTLWARPWTTRWPKLSGEHQLPSSCLLQNLCQQLSLIMAAT
jgi:hypothetical protein